MKTARTTSRHRRLLAVVLAAAALLSGACGGGAASPGTDGGSTPSSHLAAKSVPSRPGTSDGFPAKEPVYSVSARGGTPATGPGERFNHCERIWCTVHGENFF